MSALLEPTPTAPPEPPADAPAGEAPTAPAERPCATCGVALAEGQDWCLECGSAQPGRLGGRPGWRAALTVLGATALLATGAGAAAYAALNSDAQRDATAQAPPDASPITAQPPVSTAPAPTTETAPPAPTGEVDPPASEPADVPPAKAPADDAASSRPAAPAAPVQPSTPSADADTGADKGTGSGSKKKKEKPPAGPAEIELQPDFLSTYDPYQRGGNAVGDPADAVDGKAKTAWEAPVGPDGQVRIGLVVSLEKAQKLGELEMTADTPGFTVESYGAASSQLPPDVLDARWEHLDDVRDAGVSETFKLNGRFRHVLLWITAQPADVKVAIPEIKLFAQED